MTAQYLKKLMAFPYHPKSKQIDRMLFDFRTVKEIQKTLRVHHIVYRRAYEHRMQRIYATPEEIEIIRRHREATGKVGKTGLPSA